MNRLRKETLVYFFVVLALPIMAQPTNRLSRATTSTITSEVDKYGNAVITTTNRQFTHKEVFPSHIFGSSQNFWMVLLEEFRSDWSPGIEGKRATVKVDGWAGDFPNPRKKVWTILSEGDEGHVHDNYYKIIRYGCCGSLSTQMWFSLIDGQKVFTSTITPIRVIVPNSNADLTRYFAWHDSGASISPIERKKMKDLAGVLQYGSERKVFQRLLLRSGKELYLTKTAFRYQDKLHDNQMSLESGLMLWGVDKQTTKTALSNFSVILTFNNMFEVEIPVENDELQVGKAKLPEKFILEASN